MGPTNKVLSISPDVNNPALRTITFDALRDAFRDQARGLVDGGCHLLLVETIVDTLNAKAALVAIREVFDEPGNRAARHHLGDGHRSQRPYALRPDHRRVLGLGEARPAVCGGHQLRARRGRHASLYGRPRRSGRLLGLVVSERGAAQRLRSVRRAAGGDRSAAAGVRLERPGEHPRRVLRHHARSHRGDRPRHRGRRTATPAVGGAAADAPERPGAAHDPSRRQLPDDWRADQRHRLEEVRAAHSGAATSAARSRSPSIRSAAAPTSWTSTWTRACSTPSRR